MGMHAVIHCLGEDDIVVWLEGQPAMVRRTRNRRNETALSDISGASNVSLHLNRDVRVQVE